MLQEFCFTMVNVEFALKLHPRYANGPRAEEGMNGYVDHRLDCPRPNCRLYCDQNRQAAATGLLS